MIGGRRITIARVREARRTDQISISVPGDFGLDGAEAIASSTVGNSALLPYCLDFARRRSLYVGGVDPHSAQAAPFYYLHLRRSARSVVSVPWEHGRLFEGAVRAPVFLFSPGRCGSTLLSRILSRAGAPNVSEPDFYTQMTSAAVASAFNPLRRTVQKAASNMGSDLAGALGTQQPIVVKLRAESCRAPGLLLQSAERRTIFMTRDFESWARSNGRAFRNGPWKSLGKYMRAITAYAWLKRNSECHLVRYEDLLADPGTTMAALGDFLGQRIFSPAIAATMTEDSQGGTPLEQGMRADQPGWEKRFADTMTLWNSDKVRRARDRLGVDELFVR
jgi:hypothetical protein